MNVLSVDTASEKLIVTLSFNGKRYYSVTVTGKSGHSEKLLPEIDALMTQAGADVNKLDAVAAVVGPGSFTGIRIGVSAVTAIAYATGAKRIAITSFEPIAYNRKKITACVDAGHSNCYAAECENGRVLSAKFVTKEEAENLDPSEFVFGSADTPEKTLALIAEEKAERGEFCKVLEPYYLRQSQAERSGGK